MSSQGEMAMKKAFAEAWERLWFLKQNKTEPELSNTSGFAAGEDSKMAITNAKHELIERAVLMSAWQNQIGWRSVKFSSFKTKFTQFALFLKGWRLEIYDLDSSEGIVKCLFAKHTHYGFIFDSCYVVKKIPSEQKLIYSILKNIFLPRLAPIENLSETAQPIEHARFYSDPKNLSVLDFLKSAKDSEFKFQLENPDLIQARLLHEAGTFPAVAFCQHPTWPKISWGRSSIQGKNPWPHPLA